MEIKKSFTTEQYTAIYQVDDESDGKRLDQFIMNFLPSFSRVNIKKKIISGDIKISNRPHPHKASTKVYAGEKITLITKRGTNEDEYWRGKLLKLQDPEIIFEDNDILVIMKPPFMMTHPSGKHLFYCATVFYETRYGHVIHSVHRLDRETSGIMLLAKNPKTANEITPLFEDKKVSKCYFFVAHKHKDRTFPFTAHERLGPKDKHIPRQYIHCFPPESQDGKHAETHFELLEENDNYIVGMAFPRTGRQHQIRAHASYHGFPLVGDKMYNGDSTVFTRFKDEAATEEDFNLMQIPRHALHAIAISFDYKNENQKNLFVSPLSQDLKSLVLHHMGDKCTIDQLSKLIHDKTTKYLKLSD
jgi:23S rRNA pseudouridine1911/1915/1917 synthase